MAITSKVTEVSKALHVLEGLLKGIAIDNKITNEEIQSLKTWLDNHSNLSHIFPFCDAIELIDKVLEDGIITSEEQDEILSFCNSFQSLSGPIDILTMEMRNLHGLLHGIIADGKVTIEELQALKKWMLYHKSNKGKWPFDEIYKIIKKILKDGKVTKSEEAEFINLAKEFIELDSINTHRDTSIFVNQWMKSDAPTFQTIDMIIDRNTEIIIVDRTYCFTGQMKHGKRKDIQSELSTKGGIPVKGINKDTNYLVIGALSNPCWAYSTYGRKIETVIENNRKGANTSIIHEDDFIEKLRSV